MQSTYRGLHLHVFVYIKYSTMFKKIPVFLQKKLLFYKKNFAFSCKSPLWPNQITKKPLTTANWQIFCLKTLFFASCLFTSNAFCDIIYRLININVDYALFIWAS